MKTYKSFFQVLLTVVLLSESFLNSGCDPDADAKTPQQEALKKLTAKTWKIKSATVDGTDATSNFTGMSISFTETTFTVTNGSALWPSADAWSFVNESAQSIKRGDNVEVQIVTLTASSLTLTMQWSKDVFGPGRAYAIGGSYTFSFE